MEKETTERLTRQHCEATEKLTVARSDGRTLREKHGSLQARLIIANAGLKASRLVIEDY
jgi:hypothetical protein